jgi:replicative DNA helicase
MAEPADQILNVQPQSEEAEQAVLGSMLASKEAVSETIVAQPRAFLQGCSQQDLFHNDHPF